MVSIEIIFNLDLHETINADYYFSKFVDKDDYVLLRRQLVKRYKDKDPLLLCDECGTELEVSCTKNKLDHTYYFKHRRDPEFDKCSIKTGIQRSKEEILKSQYLFKSESKQHILLKNKVGSIIQQYIYPEVIIDKKNIKDKFGDKERRKPDVFFIYDNREITIEFQINNTFHSVIEDREAFYERNHISLIWVFGEFNPYEFQSITIKDIYVPNANNAFVFDSEAELASHEKKTLCLKVWYKKYKIEANEIEFDWENEIISFNQLNYDEITHRPFYYNSPEEKNILLNQLNEIKKEKEKKELQALIDKKINRIKEFLSKLKANDSITYTNELNSINNLNDYETIALNEKINLYNYKKEGNNIIQVLLLSGGHTNLIYFLLKAINLNLNLNNANNNNSTLITFLKSEDPNKFEYIRLLFAKNYLLTELDIQYINEKYEKFEALQKIQEYKYFEKAENIDQIYCIQKNLNELFVIESSKNKEVMLMGNGKQGILWLANLAIFSYEKLWFYIDLAFDQFGFYKYIFEVDKKKVFTNYYFNNKGSTYPRDAEFEEVFKLIFPEIVINI
ncbi:MAG: DUF6035 family protein [Bacteroidia bacterium]